MSSLHFVEMMRSKFNLVGSFNIYESMSKNQKILNHASAECIFTARRVYLLSICHCNPKRYSTSSMQRTKEVEILAPINNTIS